MSSTASTSGKITSGIKPNTLIDQTISFIENSLHLWRDDGTRPYAEAEEDLNGQLCKYLDNRARREFPMAGFHHEEKQGARRRVDISAWPTSDAIEATLYESIYHPILVIEGKRLPPPTSNREMEYLTGSEDKSGGVQRFRMCLHGQRHASAVMVGYVQDGEVDEWHKKINKWIADLEVSGADTTCAWSNADLLAAVIDDGKVKASRCESSHGRINGSADIRLVHLWICIPKQAKAKVKKTSPKKAKAKKKGGI